VLSGAAASVFYLQLTVVLGITYDNDLKNVDHELIMCDSPVNSTIDQLLCNRNTIEPPANIRKRWYATDSLTE
jgi:hypothetical protein